VIEHKLMRYSERIGWATVIIMVIIIGIYQGQK
jgi:hypothetical protein